MQEYKEIMDMKNDLEENFSHNFYNDRWLSTYFKIFINLEDIGYDKTTFIIPGNKKKEFIKISKYKNRKNYKETDLKEPISILEKL